MRSFARDASRFDALTRLLAHAPSRRALLPLLGGIAAPLLGIAPAMAKKKNKKKLTLCLDGQTIAASKKKKKKLLKSGATPGACASPPPPPACTLTCANSCRGDDGCGGTCACAAGSVCQAGVCHACTVKCTGSGTGCGFDLKTALADAGGGTVYACPGRYVGNFKPGNGALVGAGDGEDPATSTILDANGSGRVLEVVAGVTTALHGLRITGGNRPGDGAGIDTNGTLTLTDCTVAKNVASGVGAGILHSGASLSLNDSVVADNTATRSGGGIYASGGPLTINASAITGNTGSYGGGLYIMFGTATFDSACSVTGNTATESGGGINSGGGTVVLADPSIVSGNFPDDCENVSGC